MGRDFWYNPLSGPIDLQKCSPQNSTWSYDSRLRGDKNEILKSLRMFEENVAFQQVLSYIRMMGLLFQ